MGGARRINVARGPGSLIGPGVPYTIPADDGAHANDWVLPPHSISVDAWNSRLSSGERTTGIIHRVFRVELASGSGSNEWTARPITIPNRVDHRDDWDVFPAPANLLHGYWLPDFDESDLSFEHFAQLDQAMEQCGLLFTRTGGGTNVLNITEWLGSN